MLQYVLLPALALADKPYQLRVIANHAPEMMAVLTSSPLAAPSVRCVLYSHARVLPPQLNMRARPEDSGCQSS